jgi:glycosyltransferase involved in cell wall biosynthesis
VLKHAQRVLFTSDDERELARQSFWLYRCEERVVAYGTAPPPGGGHEAARQAEAFLARFPSLRDRRLVLHLGRLHPKKGCDLLIEAFAGAAARDPRLHLVMVGPDAVGWRDRLELQAAELGIADRVTWTGMLDGELKWGAYRAADAFILPSHQENFGISVAEALACGVPTLISDKVNIWREVLSDGAGLVGRDDLPGTAGLLARWLGLPEAARERMRRNAVGCFAARFEIGRVAEGLLEVMRESVAERRQRERPATRSA